MIWETKGMIAGCIGRMRQEGCGGCERRHACAPFEALGIGRPVGSEERPARLSTLLAFLGNVAKSFEANA